MIWEECIILLPSAARCVFQSATLPNAIEYRAQVSWVFVVPREGKACRHADRGSPCAGS